MIPKAFEATVEFLAWLAKLDGCLRRGWEHGVHEFRGRNFAGMYEAGLKPEDAARTAMDVGSDFCRPRRPYP